MLFIFRKLRHSFFQPGKLRTYVAYAVGEIVLIVVGILLALQISEANQARKDRIEERLILTRLNGELGVNLNKLSSLLRGMERKNDALEEVSMVFKSQQVENDSEFLSDVITSSLWGWTVQPLQRLIFDELNNTGRLALIQNIQLRDLITELYNEIEIMELTALARTGDYAKLTYALIPKEREPELKAGLTIEELEEFVNSVLESDLNRMVIYEQNRTDYLQRGWGRSESSIKRVKELIEDELAH